MHQVYQSLRSGELPTRKAAIKAAHGTQIVGRLSRFRATLRFNPDVGIDDNSDDDNDGGDLMQIMMMRTRAMMLLTATTTTTTTMVVLFPLSYPVIRLSPLLLSCILTGCRACSGGRPERFGSPESSQASSLVPSSRFWAVSHT